MVRVRTALLLVVNLVNVIIYHAVGILNVSMGNFFDDAALWKGFSNFVKNLSG